jgi:hypothetical protein
VKEAGRAVARIDGIDRARCRAAFERRFTASRMARDYLRVYRHLCGAADGARANEDVAGDTLPE